LQRFTRPADARWISQYEDKALLALTLVIGAVVGLVVVGFILRRVIVPVFGSLVTGILLSLYCPNARGGGIPQTKAALFICDGLSVSGRCWENLDFHPLRHPSADGLPSDLQRRATSNTGSFWQ
jgi:hypothetical protein